MTVRLGLFALALTVLCAAPAAAQDRVEVLPGTATLWEGDKLQLTALRWTGSGDAATAAWADGVTWSTDHGKVDGLGLLRAEGCPAGTTIVVTATVDGLGASARVAVRPRPVLSIHPQRVRVAPGAHLRFLVLDPSSGRDARPEAITWEADGGAIDDAGWFVAGGETGTCTVTATVNERTVTATVVVGAAPPPTPAATPTPAPVATPRLSIKQWDSDAGSMLRPALRVVFEVTNAPEGASIKLIARSRTGAKSTLRVVTAKNGERTTVKVDYPRLTRSVEVFLTDRQGKTLARVERST